MKLKRPAAMLCALAVALGGTAAIAASQGSQEDPLLTLSYLEKVLRPQLESQVDQAVERNKDQLVQALEAVVSGYEATAGQPSTGAPFQTKTLAKGDTFTPGAGRELLITSGAATALGALTDTTAGKSLAAGDKLELCHLYLTATDAAGCKATAAATVMSR